MATSVKTLLESYLTPNIFSGSGNITFPSGVDTRAHSVTTFISDTGVYNDSPIILSIGIPSGRDIDEFELAPINVNLGVVSSGIGFNVIATSLDGDAEGNYVIRYSYGRT